MEEAINTIALSLSKEQLIKQCVTLDLALERINYQQELRELSRNDWNLLFLKWSFSGKKELLDKIDRHILEIKTLEGEEPLQDLQDQNLLSSLSTQKIKHYELIPSDELSNTHSKLCVDYFYILRRLVPAKPPTSFNYTDDIERDMDTFYDKLESYRDGNEFREDPYVKYVAENKISDDLSMIDTIFKVWDGDLGKYLVTIPVIKFYLWAAEKIHNYFTSNSTNDTDTLNESNILAEVANELLDPTTLIALHSHQD
ncbi:hypothetical protein [Candidatus Tisiphia endosymbiont of Nemotelus uliginosus]|uniref:hypothetical protein n=1 Tax=Candidatus Tisiphia endosymbiont of Nemotelus uliginosus TaxID=3077926 RepID=UPI0035C89C84